MLINIIISQLLMIKLLTCVMIQIPGIKNVLNCDTDISYNKLRNLT